MEARDAMFGATAGVTLTSQQAPAASIFTQPSFSIAVGQQHSREISPDMRHVYCTVATAQMGQTSEKSSAMFNTFAMHQF